MSTVSYLFEHSNSRLLLMWHCGRSLHCSFCEGDGKCVICDSYVRPCTLVRICDECNYGSYQGRCVICGGPGVSDAYYCKECTIQEKDRDGCPKIVNLGSSKTDLFYERKKYGFKKR
ncbi:PHD finger-like domain-containing protein 5A isoform X1 [Pyrgilauda ruficollis]|uniref:PHD finger-like domain-containing protein 5A isoform X1 n=1 Tax=Pyrgilauda ruficollis TaxID=221976 RepID=UPI001B8781E5|nr:PHD finger-like domain-containing protein 5A isoform X1 [Pyrgilauda ruficollis]